MKWEKEELERLFDKWITILRVKNNWDVQLELVDNPDFWKSGDIKIDCDDKKAIVMINFRNPKQENAEELICHELLHLKLYPLDQFTEEMIINHYEEGSKESNMMYYQFFTSLEVTVEELTKCYLGAFGENKELSFGRCRTKKSFEELYEGLRPLE